MNGPFAPPHFVVNVPTPHCLKRDFVPWIINRFADRNLVEEVLAQPDYTSLARTVEKKQSFDPPNIHASGHFGVGGILGTMGNAAESPGGKQLLPILSGVARKLTDTWQIHSSIFIMETLTASFGNGNRRISRHV